MTWPTKLKQQDKDYDKDNDNGTYWWYSENKNDRPGDDGTLRSV